MTLPNGKGDVIIKILTNLQDGEGEASVARNKIKIYISRLVFCIIQFTNEQTLYLFLKKKHHSDSQKFHYPNN